MTKKRRIRSQISEKCGRFSSIDNILKFDHT